MVVAHSIDDSWDGGKLVGWSRWFPVVSPPDSLPLLSYGRGRYVRTEGDGNIELLGGYVHTMHERSIKPTLDISQTLLGQLQTNSVLDLLRG